MQLIKQPRFWLLLWGFIGAAGLIYLIIAASVQPASKDKPSALDGSAALLVGEMADFAYAFPPRRAPQIAFQYEGANYSIADFRGKTVLVNLWATWCAPCLEELPSLDRLQAKLGGARFEVVAIAADPLGAEAAAAFFDRLNIAHLKLYADPRLIFATSLGGADAMPVSVLYDARGREVGRLVGGADWSSKEALELVRSAMEG